MNYIEPIKKNLKEAIKTQELQIQQYQTKIMEYTKQIEDSKTSIEFLEKSLSNYENIEKSQYTPVS